MARLSILSDRVQTLVTNQVLPLLLATGNVAALTKQLNDTLQASGLEGRLHPNRLHALLSNDVTRSLNEATVDLTEQAACAAIAADPAVAERAAAALSALRAEAHKLRAIAADSPDEVADRLSVPPALAVLLIDGRPDRGQSKVADALRKPNAPNARHEPPDWSYQDTAVVRCLDAFSRRPAGRIGLVLPTGAGKTRTALRIVLAMLARSSDAKAPAFWVTHRRNLREQAHRELQKLIATQEDRQEGERFAELANRIKFVMVSDLTPLLESAATRPALIIVDEAHHAAAPSYQPVFANPWAAPILLLTATPNRGDRLPIGMDEIAFTITYRELAERRAVLTPTFLDFPVSDFDWSEDAVADLADYIVDRASTDFTKVLVPLADQVDPEAVLHRGRQAVRANV